MHCKPGNDGCPGGYIPDRHSIKHPSCEVHATTLGIHINQRIGQRHIKPARALAL
jgi:hypothetical protein